MDTGVSGPGSLQSLLAEQVAAAQKVIATSHEIQKRLALAGIDIELPKVAQEALPKAPEEARRVAQQLQIPSAVSTALSEPLLGGDRRWLGKLRQDRVQPHPICLKPSSPCLKPTTPMSPPSPAWTPSISRFLFPDTQTLKEKLITPSYDVEDLYKESGWWQALARSQTFKAATFITICLNAIWIGVATDCNKADVLSDAPLWVQAGENIFCLCFTFELGIRFLSFRHQGDAFKDRWFCFDAVLVAMMVYETWVEVVLLALVGTGAGASSGAVGNATVLRILRLSRLTRLMRIARIARLLRQVPELAILSKALLISMRSVTATLALLIVGIYVFAIFFTQMLSGTEAGKGQFETVPMGMHTLLVDGILADQADIINGMLGTGLLYYAAILLYMLIVALTIADMLVGVICEIIERVADAEKEEMVRESLNEKLQEIIFELDTDGSNTISKHEFAHMLGNESITYLLKDIGVDVLAMLGVVDLIFADGQEQMSTDDFVEVLLGFRDTEPTVKYQLEMKKFVKDELSALEQRMRPVVGSVSSMSSKGNK